MTPHLSLGVIGHVDHGKTSLVKALTGIDTDRLKEEKRRGMSIVLGFAHLETGKGVIDLIDVPGHENFIRAMVSGATGIDAAMLVVDAREGVKPQTEEHLAITRLLGVKRGLIAVTKSDLVDAAERTAVLARLRALLKGSYLEFAPRIFTSIVTGEGLNELRSALDAVLGESSPILAAGRFWLPIDRAFSIAGRGTVVTGTMRLGALKTGQEVELMPQGRRATVRQIEVHGCEVAEVQPGQRAGINLRQVKPSELGRGDALASPGLLHAGNLLDAQLTVLASHEKALRDGQALRLMFGTTDVAVHARLLSGACIEPGRTGVVQFRARRPVSALAGEPFIARIDSPATTVGGGRFIDVTPARHRRSNLAAMERLKVLAGGSSDEVLIERLKTAGFGGLALADLAAQLGRPEKAVADAVAANSAVMTHGKNLFYKPSFDELGDVLCSALEKFHHQFPMRQGAPLSYCRAALPASVSECLFKLLLAALHTSKRIHVGSGLVRVHGHDPLALLCEEDRQLAASIEASFRQGGTTPPDPADLLDGDARREGVFYMLAEHDILVVLQGEHPGRKIAFHCDVIKEIDRRLCDAYPPPAQFAVSQARELLGSTRKFTVPLLEHFDAAGYTRRRGDTRMMIRQEDRRR